MTDIARSIRDDMYSDVGYARDCPFGCVDQGLMSVLYFLPGQAMRTHRHLDSDEYFTAIRSDAEMYVNGRIVVLRQGHTFLRRRGVLHALRNTSTTEPLIVHSFQTPLPAADMTRWESVPDWGNLRDGACPRCWCGQEEDGLCANCDAPLWNMRHRRSKQAG
jgi:mannose-6-phosphate isomerase-like protein (cupin superfamily)